jgi:NAD(P)-dependent dehydrogenase (short-subunit alcohol dehydrogenase family)
VARSAAELAETEQRAVADGDAFVAVPADLSLPEAVDKVAALAGSDVVPWGVVHAAGGNVRKHAVDVTRDEWRFVHAVQLEAAFFLSTAIARRQLAAGASGSHVFVGSVGSTIGLPRGAPYTAAKAGVLGIVRSLAVEWATAGIRVNAVVPGYFHTALTDDLLSDPVQRERVLSRIPMGRLGSPDDVAAVAVFLLSEATAYVTGQAFTVDGGRLAS